MIRYVFVTIFLICLSVQSFAAENVIYISIDGLSRDTLYALLQKGDLPNLKTLVQRGNYRNMDLPVKRPDTLATYHSLFSGYVGASGYKSDAEPIELGASVFERLEEHVPNLTSVLILSRPLRDSVAPSLNSLLSDATASIDIVYPYNTERLHLVAAPKLFCHFEIVSSAAKTKTGKYELVLVLVL